MNISASIPNFLDDFSQEILSTFQNHISLIGIDGFCASGKTTIANDLVNRLGKAGRQIIRATTDDFQHPPEIRWKLGKESPLGFYHHAIDFEAIERELLRPLAVNKIKSYRTSTYDIFNLKSNLSAIKTANFNAILIMDGLFLQVPVLRKYWDKIIYLRASYETCILRAKSRNQEKKEDINELEKTYRNRYVKGYEIYIKEVNPETVADIVIQTD